MGFRRGEGEPTRRAELKSRVLSKAPVVNTLEKLGNRAFDIERNLEFHKGVHKTISDFASHQSLDRLHSDLHYPSQRPKTPEELYPDRAPKERTVLHADFNEGVLEGAKRVFENAHEHEDLGALSAALLEQSRDEGKATHEALATALAAYNAKRSKVVGKVNTRIDLADRKVPKNVSEFEPEE